MQIYRVWFGARGVSLGHMSARDDEETGGDVTAIWYYTGLDLMSGMDELQ